jgi:hypothetical protein
METKTKTNKRATVDAVVIKKDGTRINLGRIAGKRTAFQRLVSALGYRKLSKKH